MLNLIKKIDKENTSLKKTNKSNQEHLQTCKLFLKSFEKERKDCEVKSKKLEIENNTLLAELKQLNYNEQVGDVSEDSQLEHGNNIGKSYSNGSGSNIESTVNEGLLSFCLLYFYLFFHVLKYTIKKKYNFKLELLVCSLSL